MQRSAVEGIFTETHIRPDRARNRRMPGQHMSSSIGVGRRRQFPVSEFEKWGVRATASLQEAVRRDAVLFSNKPGHGLGWLRQADKAVGLP